VPRQADWFHRLPAIILSLEHSNAPVLDRGAIEALFQVGSRQAQNLMSRWGAVLLGNTAVVVRDHLLPQLRALTNDDDVQRDLRRRESLAEKLDLLRDQHASRQYVIAVPDHGVQRNFSRLPEGVRLRPGSLEVDFEDPRELLGKLMAFVETVAADIDEFESLAGGEPIGGPPRTRLE
jgi:hypothetical protein